ncbi:hypothetical protein [Methyloceanibacter caenitepidi]|uniref:Uncharacterized protein n=1 Tax=Methyloceanibacter caenitepidi TaxID=1384459 RepID=A0A0A8JZ83_9HYPH|nr:hypothetical protein [Methyloceanibacter caenitepidi]BAQ15652.1 hypothetical protein GL4_0182 [Methyloceanibacter caenitepidi]
MADSVKAFSRVFLTRLLKGLLAIAAFGLLLWVGITVYRHWTYDRHVKKVAVSVTVHPQGAGAICSDARDRPLFVDIVNNSPKTVEEISFRLRAQRKGDTTNLASRRAYNSNKILKPGEAWGGCLPAVLQDGVSVDPLGLEWSVGGRIVTFE